MKKLLFTIGVALVMASCSSANYVTHELPTRKPAVTRQALIYEDHVVIVTRHTMSPEQYRQIVANTQRHREQRGERFEHPRSHSRRR